MRRIGAGGMGEVFLAREEQGNQARACVVKKVLPSLIENRQFVGRFLDEAKVVVRLSHPNIARVYSMGDVKGEYYLAMEYVQGKTVSRFMHRLRQRKETMPLGLVLLIGERVCEGLQYAHDATDETGASLQLVHRDLSPANLMFCFFGAAIGTFVGILPGIGGVLSVDGSATSDGSAVDFTGNIDARAAHPAPRIENTMAGADAGLKCQV